MQEANFFERANRAIRDNETLVVNLFSAIAPWGAPLIPASMTFDNMVNKLGYHPAVALVGAGVVELLGLSTVSTSIGFWLNNRRRQAEYKRAPFEVAIGSFVFYLVVILMVNVILDAAHILAATYPWIEDWTGVFAKMLLSLLSVPAAIIMAVRTNYKNMLDAYSQEVAEQAKPAKSTRGQSVADEEENKLALVALSRKKQFLADYNSGVLAELSNYSREQWPAVIADKYQTSVRSAYRWLEQVKE